MKIVIVGPAWPYRGGIANFDEKLAHTFADRGEDVEICTFTLQYPSLLFPGKTQYSESPPPAGLSITREVNSINPLNWIAVGRRLRSERPDMVIMKYWTPFLAPCLGRIARGARRNGSTKVIVSVDNITPHEPHFFDRPLNRYFIHSVDGFVYMSQQVKDDLDTFRTDVMALFSPHPVYDGFGEGVAKEEACRELGLDPSIAYLLFFGIVRDYKGLDTLLDAWKILREGGNANGRKLIVAGEFYGNKQKYLDQIARNGLGDDVVIHDRFIPDEQVRYYFSATDVLIQPYHTATQSGVTQIAYHFGLPMIVTDVGGLAEIVPHEVVGYVTETTPESVAGAVVKFYEPGNQARFRKNTVKEKERFSWQAMAERIIEVYDLAKEKRFEKR